MEKKKLPELAFSEICYRMQETSGSIWVRKTPWKGNDYRGKTSHQRNLVVVKGIEKSWTQLQAKTTANTVKYYDVCHKSMSGHCHHLFSNRSYVEKWGRKRLKKRMWNRGGKPQAPRQPCCRTGRSVTRCVSVLPTPRLAELPSTHRDSRLLWYFCTFWASRHRNIAIDIKLEDHLMPQYTVWFL